ncbi:hypothetical protein B1A85_03125 [Chroococcidiopsis sp. TS-821]|nr:hypothetical protein B1A85_03125 [Chroococcidiopsis sp. TS-821]
MLDINWWQKVIKVIVSFFMTGLIVLSSISCGDRVTEKARNLDATRSVSSTAPRSTKIAEVSPPEVIQQLRQSLESRRPQVSILSPQPGEILQDDTINARLQVQDLPVFKNEELNLGPHLNVILDNQPYISVYNLDEPLIFSDLAPGTHTLRVFATYPWNESFKNEGAYAQTTFHIFAKDDNNSPNLDKPLLTYNTPQGTVSAEPVLLDFYLTNAPLHLVAQANQQSNIADWRIRCTINGESFIIDRWQPLYLQGLQPGRNWIQLEFIDEQGNSLPNVFNNTVRLVTYDPTATDTLGKLVKGQISLAEARGIVDPNYVNITEPPSIAPTPTPSPTPVPEVTPSPEVQLELPEAPLDEEVQQPPQDSEAKTLLESTEPAIKGDANLEDQKPGGFFNRFRRREIEPTPSVTPIEPELPKGYEETVPEKPESPAPTQDIPEIETEPQTSPEAELPNAPSEETLPEASEPTPMLERAQPLEKPGGFFNRFRRRLMTPVSPEPPSTPEIDLAPSPTEDVTTPGATEEELEPAATDNNDVVQPELSR